MIVVSHSMEDVAKIATKVMVVHDARVAMYGTVEEVFSRAEELVQMGLNVPQITQVFSRLNHLGYPVPKIFTQWSRVGGHCWICLDGGSN